MPVVVDSSVLIDVLRGSAQARSYLLAARVADTLVSVTPVRTEVLGGTRPVDVVPTMGLLSELVWLDVTVELADMAAGLRRRFHVTHAGIDVVDYLVAASAIQIGAPVATMNVRHFPMFPDLAAPY